MQDALIIDKYINDCRRACVRHTMQGYVYILVVLTVSFNVHAYICKTGGYVQTHMLTGCNV